MRELDRITNQLFSAQDGSKELMEQLAELKHSEQLAGWAIDRALELNKTNSTQRLAADITTDAQVFCDWIVSSSRASKKDIIEGTMQ